MFFTGQFFTKLRLRDFHPRIPKMGLSEARWCQKFNPGAFNDDLIQHERLKIK